ncbi:hypothetical protein BC939DRAFT_19600 [Gamsiella multidivaricata]|uniref:uncharacterized protein n=1 Tax=Gamsiella multidivaricata TaxID=101098 RepID=UPI002220AAFD|nr:uncharacterized protein BC939DRAFT_19600 [Gamsiella multidivaricata]KAI7817013.1 hypothetical protein BC939DRAFT_19600 [Gamsiella multidivaricata]
MDRYGLSRNDDEKNMKDSRSLHEKNRALWDKANSYEQPVISRNDSNNSMRTEYVPEIKILRRPKSPVQAIKVAHMAPKPLAQREADYMAAREKIFGPTTTSSNTPPTTSRSSPVSRSGSSSPMDPAYLTNQQQQQLSSSRQGVCVGSGVDVKPIEFRGPPPTIRSVQRPSGGQNDTAIRQPQGPTYIPDASISTSSKAREGSRQEGGSTGFRRPFGGARRPPHIRSD